MPLTSKQEEREKMGIREIAPDRLESLDAEVSTEIRTTYTHRTLRSFLDAVAWVYENNLFPTSGSNPFMRTLTMEVRGRADGDSNTRWDLHALPLRLLQDPPEEDWTGPLAAYGWTPKDLQRAFRNPKGQELLFGQWRSLSHEEKQTRLKGS